MRGSQLNPTTFRDRHNLLLAQASEWAAPLLRAAVTLNVSRPPSPPASWRRGVIVGADHIGDVLYNTASLQALAEGLPDCEWHYLATAPAKEVLAGNPFLKSSVSSVEEIDSLDVAICYNSGGYWRDLTKVLRHGIPNRVGYVHKGFSALVTYPIQINYPQPYPAYFRDLVAQLVGQKAEWSLRPEIYPGSENEKRAEAIWSGADLGKAPVVACFLTSRQASGVWPASRFAQAVAQIEAMMPCQTVLFGTAGDAKLLEELKAQCGLRAVTLAGRLDLLSLGCFLRKCAIVLCPDSGPRHLANAAQTPVVFVRNLAVGKIETGAYIDSEIDAAPNLERVRLHDQESAFALLEPDNLAQLVLDSLARLAP